VKNYQAPLGLLLKCLSEGIIAKEAIPQVLSYVVQHPGVTVRRAIEKLGLRALSLEGLREIVKKIINENKEVVFKLKERS